MATQEKLIKSLENLQHILNSNLTSDPSRKKDKIFLCNVITETISNPSIRVASNFNTLLNWSIEVLLQVCGDPESDVCLIGDECLNRLIIATLDGNASKIQIELHKKIKENGEAKTLRAALWRFAQLAHLIRPNKGKPYINNLLPVLCKVIERQEELIHETLSNSIPKIVATLGNFMTDADIKKLLNGFLKNLHNVSPVLRRTAANCIVTICINCKNSKYFLVYVYNSLISSLSTINDSNTSDFIIGAMGCLKLIIPHLNSSKRDTELKGSFGLTKESLELTITLEKYIQGYELCLFYLNSSYHNIVNASLETLAILLQHCSSELKNILLSSNGINKSYIYFDSQLKFKSPSSLSIKTAFSEEETTHSESELLDSVRPDIEKWIDESKLSVMNITFADTSLKTPTKSFVLDQVDYDPVNYEKDSECASSLAETESSDVTKIDLIVENVDKLVLNEKSSEKSCSFLDNRSIDANFVFQEVYVGSFNDKDVPLLYCIRLLSKLFLLPGKRNSIIPDKVTRVSVKSLALTCLSSIVKLYPDGFMQYLDKNHSQNEEEIDERQPISDILLYSDHSDPQLRGAVRILVANFLETVIINSGNDYKGWIVKYNFVNSENVFEIKNLINIIVKGLKDESSTCLRQTLIGLNTMLPILLQSNENQSSFPILQYLPFIVHNPYWLVKVKLLEVVSRLCYTTVHHITNSSHFQDKILYSILLEMLKDNDPRVRSTCSKCFVKVVPFLYFPQDDVSIDAVTYKAQMFCKEQFSEMPKDKNEPSLVKKRFINDLVYPFNKINLDIWDYVDHNLSRVVLKLKSNMLISKSKYYIFGCIETLRYLSLSYPPSVYSSAWSCFESFFLEEERSVSSILQSGTDLYNLCASLLTTSSIVYDNSCHINLLNLTGNVFAGIALRNLKPKVDYDSTDNKSTWDMFEDKSLASTTEQFLSHVIKLLNIIVHIIENLNPSLPPSKNLLTNLPSSPIKKRRNDAIEKVKMLSPIKSLEKADEKGERRNEFKVNSISSFAAFPHYMKIYEILKPAYNNYKVTLDFENKGKFMELLEIVLGTLSQILEIGSLHEFGPIAEEILTLLQTVFILSPSYTVECVQQLLRSLFGVNLTFTINNLEECRKQPKEERGGSFYQSIFQNPYTQITRFLKELRQTDKLNKIDDNILMGYLHRKLSIVSSRKSEKILASYIRLFEPMVIKSLKQYAITSDVLLQCKVLKLLCQLVQLRVNYCLLDSEQVFIGFVLKQFEYIEEGHIRMPEELIPRIFDFLVHLSYAKQHSKTIIDIPKIIQLCDGLMASGKPPVLYCIAALKPVVSDIFLLRNYSNTTDVKELETTREVLFAMLLRLIEYPEVIDLLVMILDDSKYCDNTEKWVRWSKQTVETLLPMLKMNKIKFNRKGALLSMKKLIMTLHFHAFRPLQSILSILFENPPKTENNFIDINNWLGKVITLLLMLSYVKEDVLLSEIVDIQEEFSPHSVFHSAKISSDPLNVTNPVEIFNGVLPEIVFAKFLIKTIEIISTQCVQIVKNGKENYLISQFSDFLIFCINILQSGSHCKTSRILMELFFKSEKSEFEDKQDEIMIQEINSNFSYLSSFMPNLTFYWCSFLTILNYNNRKFWAKIMQITDCYGIIEQLKICPPENTKCITTEIVRNGGIISFCDYLGENMMDGEQLSWFLINTIEQLVYLSNEAPIFEFLTSLHSNPLTSSLVIESIAAKCLNKPEPSYNLKALKCIENAHSSQIGSVLKLLLPKMLNLRYLAVSRMVVNVASRKVELLLTLSVEDVQSQLPKDDFSHMMDLLVKTKLAKKHEALIALLNKLATKFYDMSPLEFDQRRKVNPDYIKKLEINKNWYITQIKQNCFNSNLSVEIATLLTHLDYEEIVNLLTKTDFNKLILKDCIKVCVNKIIEDNLKEEPPLLKETVSVVMNTVRQLRNFIPKPHQVYEVLDRNPSPSEIKYSNKLSQLFSDDFLWSFLYETIPIVTCFIQYLSSFPTIKIPDNYYEDFIKFAVVCLESVSYILELNNFKMVKCVVDSLKCADLICKEIHLCGILGLDTHVSWLCSAVNSIYKIVSHLLSGKDYLPVISIESLKNTLENIETVSAGHCCYQLSVLVVWLEKCTHNNIPKYFMKPIKSLIVSLARLPLVNSFVLTPPSAWKNGFSIELSGIFATLVSPLPVELLKEVDILEEYIFRISLLGWTNRQQFEETWMCLLSVLNSMTVEENFTCISNDTRSISIGVKAITSFLIQTLLTPVIGNPNVSKLLHVPRNKPFDSSLESVYKLKYVQTKLVNRFREHSQFYNLNDQLFNVFTMFNLEKTDFGYSFGQLSIEYLMVSSKIIELPNKNHHITPIFMNRKEIVEESGLDLNSCLQFLLDLFSQWFSTETITIRLLLEVVQSIIIISDLFTEESQYVWMLDNFLNLVKNHTPEDEILNQYVVVGCCKAAAVLNPDLQTCETLKKLVMQNLKSAFLPCRISALHGLLYLLQKYSINFSLSKSLSEEEQLFLPIATDYALCHMSLNSDILTQSLEHTLTTWVMTFYIIENFNNTYLDSQFTSTVLKCSSSVLHSKYSTRLHITILKGLERLIIKKCLSNQCIELVMKIAVENIKMKQSPVSLSAIQLLLSCTYINSLKKKGKEIEDNPDNLVHLIEKVSIIFDYIKKGFPFEVEVLCNILPDILNYFFTPADILTKVLGEFLSQQQPNPKLLSYVVFKVFENAIDQSQLSLLQDWVVFSLSNFTNNFSMAMATWYLSCFFVSASTNPWLRSFFTYLQTRIGRYEYEDRKLLCIAGLDFYKNLTDDKQKQAFVDSFNKVKNQIDSPFNDLLASI